MATDDTTTTSASEPSNVATPVVAEAVPSVTTEMNSVSTRNYGDWRVKITLAPTANYLYRCDEILDNRYGSTHVLLPLYKTDGVVFPYTPQIAVSYNANYDSTDLTHTNYKMHQYKNSDVGQITITADFTAQDTNEAEYVLAVMYFFKSMTKMFYGQSGTGQPPPLCYLHGYGPLQFENHPMVVTNFTPTYPSDVDYIRCKSKTTYGNTNRNTASSDSKIMEFATAGARMAMSALRPGAKPSVPHFASYASTRLTSDNAVYIPTKMSMTITCLPIVSRADASNVFSMPEYASGRLNRRGTLGGFW